MRIDVLTLFPEMFAGVLGSSILKRAAEPVAVKSQPNRVRPPVVSYQLTNFRNYTQNKQGKVDQPPYGGGPGLVIQCQPVWDAVAAVERQDSHLPATRIVMTPQGRTFSQALANELSRKPRLLIIAGHYESIDQRVIEALQPIERVSIGDYVLTGGELAAMVLIDAVVRLIPGALGNEGSVEKESFSTAWGGLLDYPHYTRPAEWMDRCVPEVLLSGNHARIDTWRKKQALQRTREHRPDLIKESQSGTTEENRKAGAQGPGPTA